MPKTKQTTEALQAEELNIVDAIVSLFSSNMPVHPFVLHAEFGNIVTHALTHEREIIDKLDPSLR